MLFSTNLLAVSAVLLGAALQAHAHAAIAPMLGVSGTPARSNVQRPSTAKPCGNVNIAQTFASSGVIKLAADDTFQATITNFNGGVDGSREIASVQVDPSGTGKSFVAAKMVKNGTKAPSSNASEQLTVQLPAGTKCTGAGGKCLVTFKTDGGFGNCVVVQQGAASGAASASKTKAATAKANASASATTKAKLTTVKTGGKTASAAATATDCEEETVTVTVTVTPTATA
ncbi:uncharacterized protein BXZ73DRAFT_88227 [Epithele typhae]|uniref:uncharacterized protein n=1 Tax=Epithele typhae TaxID=378194 RepID=UPI002008AF09|nr:uncharacterized protein BXZ73DRAFT_88227 [Epithele typhae]KAH9941825.1 hypothetical protein BXZ73DRAFT_88227 [Epithele typhae]